MTDQPVALRLADELLFAGRFAYESEDVAARRRINRNSEAAAELRRLHKVNLNLIAAGFYRREWVGMTSEDWENTPDTGKQGCERDAELFDWIEQTLKEKNT